MRPRLSGGVRVLVQMRAVNEEEQETSGIITYDTVLVRTDPHANPDEPDVEQRVTLLLERERVEYEWLTTQPSYYPHVPLFFLVLSASILSSLRQPETIVHSHLNNTFSYLTHLSLVSYRLPLTFAIHS